MAGGVIVRAARDHERESLLGIMKASIGCYCVEAYGEETVKAWTGEHTSRFDFRIPERAFVAEDGGRIYAFSAWRPQQGEHGLARLTAVFVVPGAARRGLGGLVLSRAEKDALASGFPRIHLFASLNAVPFYQAMGYEETARESTEVADGHHIELVRMARGIVASSAEIAGGRG